MADTAFRPSIKIVIILAISFFGVVQAANADTTAPNTTISLNGAVGNDNWFVSTVKVYLRAFDVGSSPASTTYQVNSLPPVTNEYGSAGNSIINPSFEDGWYAVGINSWTPVSSNPSLLSQSSIAYIEYRSAQIDSGDGSSYSYWTNYDNFVPVTTGSTYSVSSWVRTINLTTSPGAWFEVWARDTANVNSDIKLTESPRINYETDWTLQTVSFTIPTGYDGVYLKLGSQASDGITWYDGVSMTTGTDAVTEFLLQNNGQNTLTYSSVDNAGNVEATKTYTPIKIDTVAPQDWTNFRWNQTGNDHTYIAYIDVQDVASGIVPSTAQYRWYDKKDCNCWSEWLNAPAVRRLDNGALAPVGYTGFVTIETEPTDMGDSSIFTLPRVQFRIHDVASAPATSPTYSLFGPWVKVVNGADIYSHGGIDSLGSIPAAEYSTQGVIISNGNVNNAKSYFNWIVKPYQLNAMPKTTLDDLLPNYSKIRARAIPLPSNRLPSTTGTYFYSGNYTIDRNTLTSAFLSTQFSAVVIIEGNLYINEDFELNDNTAVLFLVTGNVIYSEDTQTSEGFIIAVGDINTNSSNTDEVGKDGSLTHKGALIAGNKLILGRNLGKNKNDNPAETINFPVSYLVNQTFANLLLSEDQSFTWQEVSQ